jgi:hypothetical protein
MRLPLFLILALLLPTGHEGLPATNANGSTRGNQSMVDQLEITYRARDGRPSVDLDLHLAPDGRATLFVGTSQSFSSVRLNRIGDFGGQAATADIDALTDYVREHDLLAHGGSYGDFSPGTPSRFIEIQLAGRAAQFELSEMTTNAEIDGFETLILDFALTLTSQPVAAVEASLQLDVADGQIVSVIELRSIGSEPMTALLFDPEDPMSVLYAHLELRGNQKMPNGVTIPVVFGDVALSPDAVSAMASEGRLPAGIVELPIDAVYRFELPPIAVPEDAQDVVATGSLQFWKPEGKARRGLNVLTPQLQIA